MTVRDKYRENQQLLKNYRDYLTKRQIDAKLKKNAWMIKERDTHDEDELILEMARLVEENREIQNAGVQNLAILDDEYRYHTHTISAQLDTAYKTENELA